MTSQIPVFKGMRRLRFSDIEDELDEARKSPYRYWYEYLKMSKDYWWVGKQNGNTLDADLRNIWEHFGDIENLHFNNWWIKTGRTLFSEQVKLPAVKQITIDSNDISPNQQDYILLEVPLNLTERTISKQVLRILRQQAARKIERRSHAKFPLAKLRGIRMSVIRDARDIWSLHYFIQLAKKEGSTIGKPFDTMTTQQIGIALRLVKSCMPKPTDGENLERKKRNGMKVAVSRMIARANALIANAEIGVFPSFEQVAKRERWTDDQQRQLDVAIANGEWQPASVDEKYYRHLLNRPKLPR